MPAVPTNSEIAAMLETIADLLAAREENPFRVRSYRNAAASVRSTRKRIGQDVRKLGIGGVTGIPGVGERLAGLIVEFVRTGEVELIDTLREGVSPEAVQESREKRREHERTSAPLLPVRDILTIDAEYRAKAKAGKLKKITPKNLNPEKQAWLPILATTVRGWKFTVMFSNTATAHKLGKTDDWVVVYHEKGGKEDQCTVVTEQRGALKGKRVIRGRETECAKYYAG